MSTKDVLKALEEKENISSDDLMEAFKALMEMEKKDTFLSNDEINELKQILADKRAVGRVLSIMKTALISLAATILAYNVFYDTVVKILSSILHMMTGGPTK